MPKSMTRLGWLTGLLLASLVACSAPESPSTSAGEAPANGEVAPAAEVEPGREAEPAVLDLVVRDGRITARLERAPRTEVLDAISQQADVEFVFIGEDDGTTFTARLEDVPLEQGIGTLLGEGKSAYVYAGAGDERRLTRVIAVLGTRLRPPAVVVPDEPSEAGEPALPEGLPPELADALANLREQIATGDLSKQFGTLEQDLDPVKMAEIQARLEEALRAQLPPEVLERMGWEPLPRGEDLQPELFEEPAEVFEERVDEEPVERQERAR